MIILRSWVTIVFLKIYVAVALVIAATFSPLALIFIPILLLAWYFYSWRWPINTLINLLTGYFMFFAVALLLALRVGPLFSLLISLPVLLLIGYGLEEAAESLTYPGVRHGRRPTSVCLALFLIAFGTLLVSLLVGNLALLFASAAAIVYLGAMVAVVLRRLPLKPVEEKQVLQRMVAGTRAELRFEMSARTKIGGLLFLKSPYEWLKVSPDVSPLKGKRLGAAISLSPALSGPSTIKLKGYATDRWGLIETGFEIEPVVLNVIPRARYAAWLAKRYLAMTKPGDVLLISNIEALKPLYGLRRGVEYYGSQLYQPGDSIKNIDWKHSMKYNQLITKEFAEFHMQPAVVLINLDVGDAEEADKLAYNTIVTAISLAREHIPAALAVYDHEKVKLTTPALPPQQLVVQSLKIAQEMVTVVNPVKYLNPPDVSRLRANLSRIRLVETQACGVLAQLLEMEYKNLSSAAKLNPATKALVEVFNKADKHSNIVIISQRNHGGEALALNTANNATKRKPVSTREILDPAHRR